MISVSLGYAAAGVVIITVSRFIFKYGYGYYKWETEIFKLAFRMIGWMVFLVGMGAVIKSFNILIQAVLEL